jgi:hypothetical protein
MRCSSSIIITGFLVFPPGNFQKGWINSCLVKFYDDIAHIVHECQVDISFSKELELVISYITNSQSPLQKYNLELKNERIYQEK